MILVFGQTGQVARELARHLPDAQFLDRDAADLTDPAACAAQIAGCNASAVINAAAYTAVDGAETDEAMATLVNGAAPAAMARACAARGLPFVHVSTDYVFDGAGNTPFAPDAPCAPLGAYGRSKLAGEDGVRAAMTGHGPMGGTYGILRTSWVFSAHGANFVKTMLRLGAERDSLNVVADQTGGPTAAGDVAAALIVMAGALARDPSLSGTYHFSGGPNVTWAAFAREIFAQAGLGCRVNDIPASAWPTPARRPDNSRMDMATTTAAFAIPRPDWRVSLAAVLDTLHT